MCDRWLESFENFLADMGERPTIKHSLDRIDNDGPYSPDNCRWATKQEQANNRSSSRLLTYNGRTQSLVDWSRETGLHHTAIAARLDRHHWTVERALTEPIQRQGK